MSNINNLILINNEINNKMYPMIKLNNVCVPPIPFLWYREEEMICPFDFIGKFNKDKIKLVFGIDVNDNENFVIIQRNILLDKNIYVCCHSFMYYMLYPNNNEQIIEIPTSFHKNCLFEIRTIPLYGNFCEHINGLKLNESSQGSVYIHDSSFSPPGTLHIKVDCKTKMNILMCDILFKELNKKCNCIFILFNDFEGNNTNMVNDIINKLTSECP